MTTISRRAALLFLLPTLALAADDSTIRATLTLPSKDKLESMRRAIEEVDDKIKMLEDLGIKWSWQEPEQPIERGYIWSKSQGWPWIRTHVKATRKEWLAEWKIAEMEVPVD